MDANEHPYKVAVVKDDTFYANEHPYKVKIVEGGGLSAKVVDELPEEGETGYIYLVLKEETEEGDIYDEWIWAEKDGEYVWEHLGATNEVTIMLYDSTGQNTDGAMTQKAVTDELDGKQNTLTAGSNIQINNDTISATDTTYSDFTGTDGTTAGESGLVPAPATTDAGKYLKADGTWDEVQAGPTVVQTTGTSTTSVMSQKATTNMIYPAGSETNKSRINVGNGFCNGEYSVAIGANASVMYSNIRNAVALGANAEAASSYVVSVGPYGPSSTRIQSRIVNMADPISAQDASTKNYTDNLVISYSAIEGSSAPTTSTEGKYVGQLYFDTANDKKYYLKAIDTTTDPDTYTWEEFGGGGIPTNATFWGRSYNATNNSVSGPIYSSMSTLPTLPTYPHAGLYVVETDSNPVVLSLHGNSLTNDRGRFQFSGQTSGQKGWELIVGNSTVFGAYEHRIDAHSKPVVNVVDPQNDYDAVNKRYVDTHAGAVAFPTSTFNSILEEA